MIPGIEGNATLAGQSTDPEGKNRAFHGRLLDRGKTCLPARRRDRLAKRATWVAVATWLGPIFCELAVFAGGMAVGAGALLKTLPEGQKWSDGPADYIASGAGCVLLATLARLLAWSRSRRPAEAASACPPSARPDLASRAAIAGTGAPGIR